MNKLGNFLNERDGPIQQEPISLKYNPNYQIKEPIFKFLS